MITSSTITSQLLRKYSKELLKRAKPILVYDKLATLVNLEMRDGHANIRLFRPKKTNVADVQILTEGVPPTQYSTVDWETVDVNLTQYGEPYRISDIASWTQLHNIKDQVLADAAEKAAKKYERLLQEACVNTSTGFIQRYPRAVATKTFAGLSADTNANGKLAVVDLLDATTALKRQSAVTKNGSYDAAVPAEGENDLLQDSIYLNLKSYGDSQKDDLVEGNFKQLYNVRVRVGNFTFRETSGGTAGVFDDSGTILSTVVTGQSAIATVRLSGQPIQNPQIMVVDKPDSGNPMGQFMTVSWKAFFGCQITNTNFGVCHRHKYTWS